MAVKETVCLIMNQPFLTKVIHRVSYGKYVINVKKNVVFNKQIIKLVNVPVDFEGLEAHSFREKVQIWK